MRTGLGAAALALAFGCATPLAWAQADTAAARKLYAEINQQLAQMQRVSFKARRPRVGYTAEAKAWAMGGEVSKIEAIERDDSGDVVSEFYFSGAQLVFSFEAVRGFADAGQSKKQVTVNEERFYFRDGVAFKWLSGLGYNQADNPPTGPDFHPATRERQAAAAAFLAAAQKALAAPATGK